MSGWDVAGATAVSLARTDTVRRALRHISDASAADLLFLEHWEIDGPAAVSATLRASQIRRANPELAAALRAELGGKS